MSESFGEMLLELNDRRSGVLVKAAKWLNACNLEVIWVLGPDPTEPTVIVAFEDADVQGSICWTETFVDPVGFGAL